LGFWTGMGLSAWWKRLLGFFAGVLGLWMVGVMRLSLGFDTLPLMLAIAGVVSLTAVLMRRFGVQLQKISEEEQNSPAPKMQFSIRGLFMVTFCAALLLLLARVNRDGIDTYDGSAVLISMEIVLVIIFATLLCIWAALSLATPVLPTVITVVVVLLMNLILIWSIGGIEMVRFLWPSVIGTGISLLSHFGWTLATLLVLRSCGYRLTSKKLTTPKKTV